MTEVQLRLLTRDRDHGAAPRRPAPGHPEPGALRRPQAAAGPGLSGRLTPAGAPGRPGAARRAASSLAARRPSRGCCGSTGGRRRPGDRHGHRFFLDEHGLRGAFSGTGLYVVVALVAGCVLGRAGRGGLPTATSWPRWLVTWSAAGLAGWVMARVGHALGPTDPRPLAPRAEDWSPLVGDLTVAGCQRLPRAADRCPGGGWRPRCSSRCWSGCSGSRRPTRR